jgi:hypothetical protein
MIETLFEAPTFFQRGETKSSGDYAATASSSGAPSKQHHPIFLQESTLILPDSAVHSRQLRIRSR